MQNSTAMMLNNLKVSEKVQNTLTIYSLCSKTNLRDIKTCPCEDLYPCVHDSVIHNG